MKALLLRGLASFVPGGWIAQIAVAIGKFIGKFAYWLVADIADAFKEPWRAVVRVTCGVAVLCLGVYLGMAHMQEERDEWRASSKKWEIAHDKLIDDARMADAKNKSDLQSALEAKAAAEAREMAVVAKSAAGAKRVQPGAGKGAASGANNSGGSWVPGFFAVPGGQGKSAAK